MIDPGLQKSKKKQLLIGIGILFIILFVFLLNSFFEKPVEVKTTTPPSLRTIQKQESCKQLTKVEMGNGIWTFLHSTAHNDRNYEFLFKIIHELPTLVACRQCANHFKTVLTDHPFPKHKLKDFTNDDVSIWLCELHNLVNKRTDKPLFECSMEALNARWSFKVDPSSNTKCLVKP